MTLQHRALRFRSSVPSLLAPFFIFRSHLFSPCGDENAFQRRRRIILGTRWSWRIKHNILFGSRACAISFKTSFSVSKDDTPARTRLTTIDFVHYYTYYCVVAFCWIPLRRASPVSAFRFLSGTERVGNTFIATFRNIIRITLSRIGRFYTRRLCAR